MLVAPPLTMGSGPVRIAGVLQQVDAANPTHRQSVAVLRLTDLSSNHNQPWFAARMTEQILNCDDLIIRSHPDAGLINEGVTRPAIFEAP